MHTVYRRLKKAFPFVGTRAATEDDLFSFCADRRIELVFDRNIAVGVYVLFGGDHFIFLNNRLRGHRLLHVAFHEIGHYLLHAPTRSRYKAEFFHLHASDKTHCEAETVAALLLLPPPELAEVLAAGVNRLDDEMAALVATRIEIATRYEI